MSKFTELFNETLDKMEEMGFAPYFYSPYCPIHVCEPFSKDVKTAYGRKIEREQLGIFCVNYGLF